MHVIAIHNLFPLATTKKPNYSLLLLFPECRVIPSKFSFKIVIQGSSSPYTRRERAMTENNDFPYSLRVDPLRRFSIIRFPNDTHIFNALSAFAQSLPQEDFFSLTRTPREISVIQDAKYPTYPQELGEDTAKEMKTEEGFVLIEVVPEVGGQIDFGIVVTKWYTDCSCNRITGPAGKCIGRTKTCLVCNQHI
jgi:hypothetical protein